MKTTMFVTVLFTMLVSGAAFGQELSATVPFGFTANQVQMPAGNYDLKTTATGAIVQIRNADSHKSAFIGSTSRDYPTRECKPRLVFRNADGHWALAEIWTADSGYYVRVPKAREGAKIQMATIYLNRATNGD